MLTTNAENVVSALAPDIVLRIVRLPFTSSNKSILINDQVLRSQPRSAGSAFRRDTTPLIVTSFALSTTLVFQT